MNYNVVFSVDEITIFDDQLKKRLNVFAEMRGGLNLNKAEIEEISRVKIDIHD